MLFAIIFSSLLWCYRYWWLLFFIFLSCYHLVSMHITCLCVFQCLCVVCWWYWLMLTVLRVCVPNYPSRVLVNGRWCMRIRRRQRFTTTHLYVTQTRTIKKIAHIPYATFYACFMLCVRINLIWFLLPSGFHFITLAYSINHSRHEGSDCMRWSGVNICIWSCDSIFK